MVKSNWDKKVGEKDFVRLAIIIGVLVLSYFVYVNFIPKDFGSTMKVDVIEISVYCEDCFDLSVVEFSLGEMGIEVDDHDVYASVSDKGIKMIEKYGIEKLPAFVVVSKKVGEMGLEGAFDVNEKYAVFNMNTPYIDVASGELDGIVDMIEISPACEECFSLTQIKAQFENTGIRVGNYEIVSAESTRGEGLIHYYDLDFAPVVLISKDIDAYDWIMPSLGNVLRDGGDYYVFSTAIAPYKDLASGEVKGLVDVISLVDASCEDCFDVKELTQSFQAMGVYFDDKKVMDISSTVGKKIVEKYNITAVPTIVLSKEILDYSQLKDILWEVGTFDEEDQSFVFRKLEVVGKFAEIDL